MRQSILDTHRRLLGRWRDKMDLIGPGPMEPHFTDAISAVSSLPLLESWVDLGSGAGFPGIALGASYPNAQVTLIESRHKRATFLKQVIRQSNAQNITVLCERTENITHTFNGIISRAYKPPLEFLKDADRLVSPQGYAVCLLGESGHFNIPNNWEFISEEIYLVSDNDGHRKRWILRRKD